MAHYTKNYSEPSVLVTLLKNRGLSIYHEAKAQQYLKRIGYYRLSAYFYPLLSIPKEAHQFKAGSTFGQALDMYRFDRQLRLLIFNQIEKIEIAVRSAIVSVMSKETGDPFWITNPAHFADIAKFNSSMQKIQQEYSKSREDFIEHFRSTYNDPFPHLGCLQKSFRLVFSLEFMRILKSAYIVRRLQRSLTLTFLSLHHG